MIEYTNQQQAESTGKGCKKIQENCINSKCVLLAHRKSLDIEFLKTDKCFRGYEYIMVVKNCFRCYTKAYRTCSKSSNTVAQKLLSDFMLRFGCREKILQDQGKGFQNNVLHHLQKQRGVKKFSTTQYHPMTNGLAERINSTIVQMLKTLS